MKNRLETLEKKIDVNCEKIKKRLPIILIFTIIFILLAFQHNHVAMYFDDFGNGSLSYIEPTPEIPGTNWNISQLLHWDIQTYKIRI